MSSSDSGLQEHSEGSSPLEVRISVAPPEDCGCGSGEPSSSDVQQSLTMRDDGPWTCDIVTNGEDGCEYKQNDVCDACPCYQFAINECVAEVLDIRNGRIHYSVVIPDRSKLAPLVGNLREAGATVSVYRILTAGEGEDRAPTLTDKQRQTLELAIEKGYYDRPRGATLEEIADELDVTTSAISQRLNSVNRRLIHRYAEDTCIDQPG